MVVAIQFFLFSQRKPLVAAFADQFLHPVSIFAGEGNLQDVIGKIGRQPTADCVEESTKNGSFASGKY